MPRSQFSIVARGIWYLAANLACDNPVRERTCLMVILLDVVVALVDDLDVVEEVVIFVVRQQPVVPILVVHLALTGVRLGARGAELNHSVLIADRPKLALAVRRLDEIEV